MYGDPINEPAKTSARMLFTPAEAELVFKLHRALMFFINQQLRILPEIKTVAEYSGQPPDARFKAQRPFLDDIDLIEKL